MLRETANGIAKNFTDLERAEKAANSLWENQRSLHVSVEELSRSLDIIKSENAEAVRAQEGVKKLDTDLSLIEKKMEAMEKARVWLAEIETRMQNTYDEIKQNLKLLAGSGKVAGQNNVRNSTPEERATIIRLIKEQKFSVEQAAQLTKRSIGEVQLILDYAPT
jgi:chromosome segregation ATPase